MKYISKLILVNILVLASALIVISEVSYYLNNENQFFFKNNTTDKKIKDFRSSRALIESKNNFKMRIGFSGGSTTFGLGLKESATIPVEFQKRFKRKADIDSVVINFGYPGAHLRQMTLDINNLSEELVPLNNWEENHQNKKLIPSKNYGVRDFELDYLLVAPIVNDLVAEYFLYNNIFTSTCNFFKSNLVFKNFAISEIYCSIGKTFLRGKLDKERVDEIGVLFEERLNIYLQTLKKYSRNTEIILVSLPTYFNNKMDNYKIKNALYYFSLQTDKKTVNHYSQYPYLITYEFQIIQKVAEETGLPVIDLGNLFSEFPEEKKLKLYIDPIHTSERASKILAKEITKEFTRILMNN